LDGDIVQHIEYVPFGEVFIEERNNTWNTPYLFNAKELDEETGLYYYGARYYEPRISLWLSVDPLGEKYPNVSAYVYTFQNPIMFIDPDGQDPIYAKNFWGKVRTIGDDGQTSTDSYLVRGSVAREVKAATKAGEFYTGSLAENKNVMHVPTGQIQQDVQQTATATINSGTSPDTRVENGGHSLHGDANARIWDAGTPVQTTTRSDGSIEKRWSVTPFRIGGKNGQVGGPASSIQFIWHIHPNGSTPSDADYKGMSNWRSNGFTGNTFLIDVENGRVTFFNEKGTLKTIKYTDFIKMGNQQEIK
jgi:RHS repeat-associated protein